MMATIRTGASSVILAPSPTLAGVALARPVTGSARKWPLRYPPQMTRLRCIGQRPLSTGSGSPLAQGAVARGPRPLLEPKGANPLDPIRPGRDQANQDPLLNEPLLWHRGYPPPQHPPEHCVVSIWLIARHLWSGHHDGEDGYCITCKYPRVPAPCPDQVLAQHVMIQSIILGNGAESLEAVRVLAREARAWLPVGGETRPSGRPVAGVNVLTTYQHDQP